MSRGHFGYCGHFVSTAGNFKIAKINTNAERSGVCAGVGAAWARFITAHYQLRALGGFGRPANFFETPKWPHAKLLYNILNIAIILLK